MAITERGHQYVSVVRHDGIAIVTLNRPEKRTRFRSRSCANCTLYSAIGEDRAVRVVVLRGEGPAFSAGHDLREMVNRSIDAYREIFDACIDLMTTIQRIPQPVIAEVAGITTAAGCQLVASCDLAVASSAAKFATPGVKIGLFCSTPMVALTRAIGRKRAMEMLLTGEFIDARTAAEWGLVNRVVEPAALVETVRALATKIASAASFVVGLGKRHFTRKSNSINRMHMPMPERS